MPTIDVGDGAGIYYEDFGEGPPVLFVHGGGATHAVWRQQVLGLSDEFRTISIDLRGVGSSEKPRSGYALDRFADDLADIRTALGLDDLVIVGHGVGNHIILRSAHRNPDVAARIVLCAAAPWYAGENHGTSTEGGFSTELAQYLSDGVTTSNTQTQWEIIQHWLFAEPPTDVVAYTNLAMALEWPPYVWKMLERDLMSVDHRPYLPQITQPVLIAHGVHDKKNRYGGAAVLAEHLPTCTVVTFEESAHCPMVEEVHRFNEVLKEFARP